MPKATIARIEGYCRGGGGSVRLPRLVGRGRALEIILGCGDFGADVAERYGYVNRALPADEIAHFVTSLAHCIATFPAEAIALAKQAVAMQTPALARCCFDHMWGAFADRQATTP